jgi:hypothetical protein
MTLLGFLWFILAITGAFILGILVGRFWEGTLIVDGKAVGGHSHGDGDGHH